MTITIRLKTNNAAFEDKETEVRRILLDWFQSHHFFTRGPLSLQDINGNTVGSVKVTGG